MKADWFADLALADNSDPFANSEMASTATSVISIDTSSAELDKRISSLIKREALLFDRGIVCPLKDAAESTCLACPVSKLGESESPLSLLCRLGQEQERVITMRLAKSIGV